MEQALCRRSAGALWIEASAQVARSGKKSKITKISKRANFRQLCTKKFGQANKTPSVRIGLIRGLIPSKAPDQPFGGLQRRFLVRQRGSEEQVTMQIIESQENKQK